jgi:hypothetical protein
MSCAMNREKARENVFDLIEWDLVWSVGKSFGRIFVDFHKNPINSGCDSTAGQNGSKFAIATGGPS